MKADSNSIKTTRPYTFNIWNWLGLAFVFGFGLYPAIKLCFMLPFIGPQIAPLFGLYPIGFIVMFVIRALKAPKGPQHPPAILTIALVPVLIILQILGYVIFSSAMILTGHSDWLDIGAHIA